MRFHTSNSAYEEETWFSWSCTRFLIIMILLYWAVALHNIEMFSKIRVRISSVFKSNIPRWVVSIFVVAVCMDIISMCVAIFKRYRKFTSGQTAFLFVMCRFTLLYFFEQLKRVFHWSGFLFFLYWIDTIFKFYNNYCVLFCARWTFSLTDPNYLFLIFLFNSHSFSKVFKYFSWLCIFSGVFCLA